MSILEKAVLDSQYFDAQAWQWNENPVYAERADKIAQALRAMVPLSTDMSALDFGCGIGLLSFPLKGALGSITLGDTSAGMLELAQQKIAEQGADNMRVMPLDSSTTVLPDAQYDLIYTSMALHHIPDTEALLAVFHRHLNPGGWLAIADLDQEDGSFHGADVEVHHGFQREALAQLAHQAGFTDIAFQTPLVIEKDKPEGKRSYPVFLMAARKA